VTWLSQPTLAHYLVLGAILFSISVIGVFLNRRNVLIILMAIELMLLAVNSISSLSHASSATRPDRCSFLHPDRRAAESAIDWRSSYCCSVTSGRSTSRTSASCAADQTMTSMQYLYLLVPLAPLAGAIVVGLWGRSSPRRVTLAVHPRRGRVDGGSDSSCATFWPAIRSTATCTSG